MLLSMHFTTLTYFALSQITPHLHINGHVQRFKGPSPVSNVCLFITQKVLQLPITSENIKRRLEKI